MAELEKKPSGISKMFNSIVKHVLSVGMIYMSLSMAFPMVAAATSAAGTTATWGDIGLAAWDSGKSMALGFWTDLGVPFDATANAMDGNWAAESYELGMHDEHLEMMSGSNEPLPTYEEFEETLTPEEKEQINALDALDLE